MKLKKLKEIIDQCVENAGDTDPEVEACLGEDCYEIDSIGQFSIMPDVTITIGEKLYEGI